MIGTMLSDLVRMFRAETGQTLNAASATQDDVASKLLLSRTQLMLAAMYDWPFLRKYWDVAAASFVDLPVQGGYLAIDFSRPVRVETLYGGTWLPVGYGITGDDRNAYSDDTTCDPVRKWQFYRHVVEGEDPVNQAELWPRPQTAQTVRFTGQRALLPLRNDRDQAELDDVLIVLSAAAEKMMASEPERAKAKAMLASQRLAMLRQSLPSDDEPIVLGRNTAYVAEPRRLVPIITAS